MHTIFAKAPINKQAALLVSQTNCEDEKGYLTRDQLAQLIQILKNRRDIVGAGFVFYNKQHRDRFCRLIRRGMLDKRVTSDINAAREYAGLGVEINRLQDDLKLWRKVRKTGLELSRQDWKKSTCSAVSLV
jgi:hypothetical protein